jgi:hypothetical protein
VPVARKKVTASSESLPKPGERIVLQKLPPGLLNGLPEEDQKAITAIVGVPIRFLGFDDDGRLELEFMEHGGTIHHIYVDRRFVKAIKSRRKKIIKRRK